MVCLKAMAMKLPKNLTVHDNISLSMKIFLRNLDPIKYSYLKIDEIKHHKISKKNIRTSPW